jgi:hypothetical protein
MAVLCDRSDFWKSPVERKNRHKDATEDERKNISKKLTKGCPYIFGEISDLIFGLAFEDEPPYELIMAKIDFEMKEMKNQELVWEKFPAEKWKEISVIPMEF